MFNYTDHTTAIRYAISYAVNHPNITAEELAKMFDLNPQQSEGIIETASHMWPDLYGGYDEYLASDYR